MKIPQLKLPFIKPLKEYAVTTRAFSDLLPYGVKIDDKTILNKDGSLMATYTYRGGDMGSESQLNMADLNRRFNDAIKRFGVGWMFHISCERKQAQGYPKGSYFTDATSAIIDQIRMISFESEGEHYINEYWLDVTYLPPADSTRKGEEFLIEGQRELGPEHAAKETLKHFNEQLTLLQGMIGTDLQLRRVGVTPVEDEHGVVEIDEQVSHLIKCAMNRDIRLKRLAPEADVSTVVGCAPLRGGFRLKMDDMLCSVIIINDMPDESFAGMFDILNRIEADYRACWRFIVRDPDAALKDIEIERGKWHGKRRSASDALQQKETRFENTDAVKMADCANRAAGISRSGEAIFGYFTMSLVFWKKIKVLDEAREGEEEAWTELRKQQDMVASYIHRIHFQTYHEQENVLEAFLGTLPGMGSAQLRKPMLSSRNLADFVPTTAVWTGEATNPCQYYPADSPPLAYVSTNGCTPFSLNIHSGDVGHFLVTGDTGSGKALDVSTPIATPNGWVRMGDLRIGDAVLGKNGKPTTVTGVFPQGIKAANRVRFSDGTSLVACDEHQWAVQTKVQKYRKQGYRTMNTAQIRNWMSRYDAEFFIPMAEPLEFEAKNLPIDPYLLGVMIGDGTLRERGAVETTSADPGIHDAFEELLPTGTETVYATRLSRRVPATQRTYLPHSTGTGYAAHLDKNPLAKSVMALGMNGKRARQKEIPKDYLLGSVAQRTALLQGLLDTDGTTTGGTAVEFSTTSQILADQMVSLVESLGGTARIVTRIGSYTNGERTATRMNYRVYAQTHRSITPFRLERKLAQWKPYTKYGPYRMIVGIEPVEPREMQCIAVAAEDHLYVAEHGIVTHNSVLLGFLLAQHRRYPQSRQIVFDVGRSHYTLCQAVGGLHYEIGGDDGVAFCPLAHIDEANERAWAEQWVGLLVAKRGVDPVVARKQIVKALENMARNGPPYSLSNLMRQPYLEPNVVEAIRYYTVEGNTNGILDAEHDSLNNSDFIVFEMQGLMEADHGLREPALLFLFHYIERLCTGRPTLFVLEEVWTFLDNPQASEFIKKWLKTLRKMNVAVGFANQSLGEFTRSPIADTIIGSCMTKILLANPNASTSQQREAYEKIGLTSWQRKHLAAAKRKLEYYFVSDAGKRMIRLDLSEVELAFVGISAKDDVTRVRHMVEEENALLAEYGPLPLDKHFPWQARWIAERVGKRVNPETGHAWALEWLEAWKQRGGYNRGRDADAEPALATRMDSSD